MHSHKPKPAVPARKSAFPEYIWSSWKRVAQSRVRHFASRRSLTNLLSKRVSHQCSKIGRASIFALLNRCLLLELRG